MRHIIAAFFSWCLFGSLPGFAAEIPEKNPNIVFILIDDMGLNLVGGEVHDSLEWKLRLADNIEWTRLNFHHFGPRVKRVVVLGHAKITENHADYFSALVKEAQQFSKPVLYLHGDGHRWSKGYLWEAKNLLSVQVDEESMAPPVKISVTEDDRQPFMFDRRLEVNQK